MTAAPFVTLGNVTVDDLVFADGSTKWRTPGGNSIYSALGMALWGEKPEVIAPLGPEYPLEPLGDRVDMSHCRPIPRNLRNWGLYEEDGTRTFVFRSNMQDWFEFSPTPDDLDEGPYANVHIAPLPWELHIALAESLRRMGARLISLDPDERNLHAIERRTLRQLFGCVDLVLPSRQEAAVISPGATPPDALRSLRELAPEAPIVAIKCGSEGVIAHSAASRDYIRVPAVPVAVVDPTGAGDAFCGGFLVGFARSRDPVEAVLHGAVSGSFTVEGIGIEGLLAAAPAAVEQRLRALRARVELRAF